jgi:addiction module HigA family antidote
MPRTPIHPGEHLADMLRGLEIDASAFAAKIDVPASRVAGIINGTQAITGNLAMRLGHFLGQDPQFWMNLNSLYKRRLAQQKARRGGAARATQAVRRSRDIR